MRRNCLILIFTLLISQTLDAQGNKELWGIAAGGHNGGGHYGAGCIYKADSSGDRPIPVFSFPAYDLWPTRNSLQFLNSGKLLCVSYDGGQNTHTNGVSGGGISIFNTNFSSPNKIMDFGSQINTTFGVNPTGKLIAANNGLMYGLCERGGAHDQGTLYEFDPNSNNIRKIIDFKDSITGAFPQGTLITGPNGRLYGVTKRGGKILPSNFGAGVLFEFNPSTGSIIVKKKFEFLVTGGEPVNGLTKPINGFVYGLTTIAGTLFKYNIAADTLTVLYKFVGSVSGNMPVRELLLAKNGNLYTSTSKGARYGQGAIIKIDILKDKVTVKRSVQGTSPTSFLSDFIQTDSTKLITYLQTGSRIDLLEYDIKSDALSLIKTFRGSGNGGFGGLFTISNQEVLLYDIDELWKYNLISDSIIIHVQKSYNILGVDPIGEIVQAANGNIYGNTYSGGKFNKGVLYEFNPKTQAYRVCYHYNSDSLSSNVSGGLLLHKNGKIYGLTTDKYRGSFSSLFEYNPMNDSLIFLHVLGLRRVTGTPCQDKKGNLFGMTDTSIFEFDLNKDSLIREKVWDKNVLGIAPSGQLTLGKDGRFYTRTTHFGQFGNGAVFSYDPVSDSIRVELQISNFYKGIGTSFLELDSGQFVSGASGGIGFNLKGFIYEFNSISSSIPQTEHIYFKNFSTPTGRLLKASNGNYYVPGTSGIIQVQPKLGGGYNLLMRGEFRDYFLGSARILNGRRGVSGLIEVDGCYPSIKKVDFPVCDSTLFRGKMRYSDEYFLDTVLNGASSGCDSILITHLRVLNTSKENTILKGACDSLHWLGKVLIATGTYKDTLVNSAGCDSIISLDLKINKNSFATWNVTACDRYYLPGKPFLYVTQSGTVKDTIKNFAGCDSVLSINVRINKSEFYKEIKSECDSAKWNQTGKIYTSSGVYIDSVPLPNGCFKWFELDLTINKSKSQVISVRNCNSFIAPSGRKRWNVSGTYFDTIKTVAGCDSTIEINLVLDTVDVYMKKQGNDLVAFPFGGSYSWLDCNNNYADLGEYNRFFRPLKTGSYAFAYSNNTCTDTTKCSEFIPLKAGSENSILKGTIRPNPTDGKIILEFHRGAIPSITVYSMNGLKVNSTINYFSEKQVEVLINASPGVYNLVINDEMGNISTHRLVLIE